MSPLEVAVVGGLGALGALLRHELCTRVADPLRAIHVLNVLGGLALGVLSVRASAEVVTLVGGGLLGATTTFSSWMVGVAGRNPWLHIALPLFLGLVAAGLGRVLGLEVLG